MTSESTNAPTEAGANETDQLGGRSDTSVSAAERFASKVNRDGRWSLFRRAPGKCWEWTGAKSKGGYGVLRVDGGAVYAHRFSLKQAGGHIPAGRVVDHLCRRRHCVNPSHLEAVTMRTNILRGTSPSARAARRNACRFGHPYDLANTYIRPQGHRECRTCHAAQERVRARRGRHA